MAFVFLTAQTLYFCNYWNNERSADIFGFMAIPVYFGCYTLISIGWSMIRLGDCEEAQKELMKEIELARKELK